MKTTGEILKSLREEKGVSIEEMVEQLKLYGVNPSKSMISRWENEKADPSMVYARILTKYFNVTLDYIIGLSDIKGPSRQNKKDNITSFSTAKEASEYLLRMPSMAAFGGYDINKMTDEEIIEFANELLHQFELISHKYKK